MQVKLDVLPAAVPKDGYCKYCAGCHGKIFPTEPYLALAWGDGLAHGAGRCLCHPVTVQFFNHGVFHLRRECYGAKVRDAALLKSIGAKIAGFNRSKRFARLAQREERRYVDLQLKFRKAWEGAAA